MRVRLALLPLLLGTMFSWTTARAQSAVVRAVLFFSPTCPHCHLVMTEILPPLREAYGDRLRIAEIDVTEPDGQELYRQAVTELGIPEERLGVPTLIVGRYVMVGSLEIPQYFPQLIEAGLSAGGVDWPAISGLEAVVGPQSPPEQPAASIGERLARDPVGNGLALAVLVLLVGVVGFAGWRWRRPARSRVPKRAGLGGRTAWMIGAALVGLIASGYLAWTELASSEVVCGPVGDCTSVQASPYSMLFGVLPVALLGVAGYLLLLAAVMLAAGSRGRQRQYALLSILAMSTVGALFSIYLTALEPFVIGATCAWCLVSALAMACLLALAVDPARRGFHQLRAAKG